MTVTGIYNCPKCSHTKWYVWKLDGVMECANCGFEERFGKQYTVDLP